MSRIERLPLAGTPEQPRFRSGAAVQPAGAELSPILERLCLLALFAGWLGFWVAVVWWILK